MRDVRDPVIEPFWEGDRLIVEVADGRVAATGVDGEAIDLDATIADALLARVRAGQAVLDVHLTPRAAGTTEGAVVGEVSVPSGTELAGQMFVGGAASRRVELRRALEPVELGSDVVVVAVDLLELDHESLLDIPLLERKRLLESVLDEGPLVRVGAYVRPPVDAWLGTWRALGFRQVVYKAANGRYLPGERNDGWAIAQIPQR
ncbi:MAG TPA: hypothetical protein VFS32_05875 [Candidatus Limnocylindrales bacterium]|nr:hypothetical protein [Candidatus Limnocylindrales bacterium]